MKWVTRENVHVDRRSAQTRWLTAALIAFILCDTKYFVDVELGVD